MDRKAIKKAIENSGDIFSSISCAEDSFLGRHGTPERREYYKKGFQGEREQLQTLVDAAQAYLDITRDAEPPTIPWSKMHGGKG